MDERHAGLVAELRALRAEAGLTLRELSLQVHVSDSSLSRYFAGQALPPWEVVATLTDLGGGNHAELRRLWDGAQRERRQARWPATGAPDVTAVVAAERRLAPVVGICALIAASGAVGWALGRR
ncbi:helix-turn-helix domain-containing protein [Paractinoplanes abujensis]|uniref:DNA-binding XRE family transcriptional regulator n=1 Tax=Paractinoplanes abujensis TaxID=882441 RepID=A0A7W7G207_9ACTN|nr:helix-turn-helix transcriptional regulator [Actinoplanes abujensis]MBB4691166.1 DNA-binding XRE family transcriptional regulator [Actinoplanes abujensis]